MIPVTAWPGAELKIGLTPFFFTIFVCYFPVGRGCGNDVPSLPAALSLVLL